MGEMIRSQNKRIAKVRKFSGDVNVQLLSDLFETNEKILKQLEYQSRLMHDLAMRQNGAS